MSRKSLTGIGPTKHFLISESILLHSSFSGWVVAANFVALLRVFFAGVLRRSVDMSESEPRREGKVNNTYLQELRLLKYGANGRVAKDECNREWVTVAFVCSGLGNTGSRFCSGQVTNGPVVTRVQIKRERLRFQ